MSPTVRAPRRDRQGPEAVRHYRLLLGLSRAPEIIFDQGLSDLFVVRTAGNVVDDVGLGSIEYAVEHFGTRLIVVVGHTECGAG